MNALFVVSEDSFNCASAVFSDATFLIVPFQIFFSTPVHNFKMFFFTTFKGPIINKNPCYSIKLQVL